MKNKIGILLVLALCLSVFSTVSASPLSDTTTMSVVQDEYVVYRLENFPANDTYFVYMGENGSFGIGGILVSKVTTNKGGTFQAKFFIPEDLKGEDVIAIRFESQDGHAPWWNYFYNDTGTYGGGTSSSGTSYNVLKPGVPQFTVVKVVKGSSITLRTKYLPDNQRWAVWIKDGALANKDWIEVIGFDSDAGGIQTIVVPIPNSLQYNEVLAIKVQSIQTDDFWFPGPIKNRSYP